MICRPAHGKKWKDTRKQASVPQGSQEMNVLQRGALKSFKYKYIKINYAFDFSLTMATFILGLSAIYICNLWT